MAPCSARVSAVSENKGGGAGGSIGAKFTAASDPDGYTITGLARRIADHGTSRAQEHRLRPGQLFVPVAQLIETPLVDPVHPSLPVETMAELVTYAKANPGKVSWGSRKDLVSRPTS